MGLMGWSVFVLGWTDVCRFLEVYGCCHLPIEQRIRHRLGRNHRTGHGGFLQRAIGLRLGYILNHCLRGVVGRGEGR